MVKTLSSIAILFVLVYGGTFASATALIKSPTSDIVISGHDLRKTVRCNGDKVVIDANNSVFTLRGQCDEVEVNGAENTITIDVVATIVLNSADNTVWWKKAANGDKPKVIDESSGNKVTQLK